jgi:hypothetical protein
MSHPTSSCEGRSLPQGLLIADALSEQVPHMNADTSLKRSGVAALRGIPYSGLQSNGDVLTRVMALDLDKVKRRLVDPKRYGVKQDVADRAIMEFKRFFFLTGTEKPPLVPSKAVDIVWHEFLMFTKDYSQSCGRLFGKFIHHEPTDGAPEERASLESAFNRTAELYRHYFGAEYVDRSLSGDCCDGESCHTCHDKDCCSTDNGGGGL